ncbi:MAG: peptidoglycan-binding protein LysM [Acidovorax sp. SCN 68-22]|jgi:nucleoid-associated protein YgaU|nr:MAG: peptidoglycan-binding protein LysM [Acidovorax sp. SCN 68-22]
MGLFSFIKEAGEKLFGGKEVEAAVTQAAGNPAAKPSLDALNQQAARAIETYIASQKLGVEGVSVEYDGATGTVNVSGQAPSQEALEKVTLCCGNVASVKQVNNLMAVATPEPEAQYHDVVRGDTLSAIAKKYYGDANKYPKIFEANKPMLSHPDKIYPGQKLRIPPL